MHIFFARLQSLVAVCATVTAIGAGIAGVASLVYLTGGTQTAYSHLGYIPVIVAAYLGGAPGGAVAAAAMGLALGPIMPMSVEAGLAQPMVNWLTRLSLFLAVGAAAGALFQRVAGTLHKLRAFAHRDPATGLLNIRALETDLGRAIGAAGRDGSAVLIVVDIEGEDQALAALGPARVDELMSSVAGRLGRVLDNGTELYHLRACRFAAMFPGIDVRAARRRAADLVDAIGDGVPLDGIPVHMSARTGAAAYPEHAKTAMDMIACATVAMQAAKDSQSVSAVYAPQTADQYSQSYALLNDLSAALRTGRQFHLQFQPIVDLRTGQCVAAEALVRWTRGEHGPVSPGVFVPLAEQTGLITPLTALVIDRAFQAAAEWRSAGYPWRVAVNLSAQNLTESGFARDATELAASYGLDPADVELEVTETAMMGDPHEAIETLWQLRRRGFHIAIDDFGTGQSSLAYLKSLPVDTVKIDGAFLRELVPDSTDALIVRSTVGLADELGLETVAEGIEQATTLRHLRSWGATRAQGFHIARPMSVSALADWQPPLHQVA